MVTAAALALIVMTWATDAANWATGATFRLAKRLHRLTARMLRACQALAAWTVARQTFGRDWQGVDDAAT